jgi:hypothetical protein
MHPEYPREGPAADRPAQSLLNKNAASCTFFGTMRTAERYSSQANIRRISLCRGVGPLAASPEFWAPRLLGDALRRVFFCESYIQPTHSRLLGEKNQIRGFSRYSPETQFGDTPSTSKEGAEHLSSTTDSAMKVLAKMDIAAQFDRLVDELLTGQPQRCKFEIWEIDILLDALSCHLGSSTQSAIALLHYREAGLRQIEDGAALPMKLSEFMASRAEPSRRKRVSEQPARLSRVSRRPERRRAIDKIAAARKSAKA